MGAKTLFQRIMDGEIPGDILYEDEQCVALRDINPQAPVHILIVPRKPIPSVNEIEEEDIPLMGHLIWVAKKLAREHGVADKGYRLVVNTGPEAGQSIYHLHIHLLGGRPMGWPPG